MEYFVQCIPCTWINNNSFEEELRNSQQPNVSVRSQSLETNKFDQFHSNKNKTHCHTFGEDEIGRMRSHSSPAIIVPHDLQRQLLENIEIAEDIRMEQYESKNLAMQRLISCSDSNRRVSKTIQFSDFDQESDILLPLMDIKQDNDDSLFPMDDGLDEFNTSPSSVVYTKVKQSVF